MLRCWKLSAKGPAFISRENDRGTVMKNSCTVGIDIGGTNFRIGAVYPDWTVSHFRRMPVTQVFQTRDAMGDLASCLRDYRSMLNREGIEIDAVSIGFPATLDRSRQIVLQAPNLPFIERLPVVPALSGILGIPVMIERDVTMALLYDKNRYKLADAGIVAGFYFGTGIGNAICIDGAPLLGRNGTAGELGHIPVDGSNIPCGCGNIGCMESLAGGKYLAQLCREQYPDTSISNLFCAHGTEPLLLQFVDRMAIAVATEINILDPDYVLIGGGVPNMEGFPANFLLERILFRVRKPYPAQDLPIILTDDVEEKGVVGAVYYAYSRK